MNRFTFGNILATIILTLTLLMLSIFLAGGGHGTYLPMKFFFPYSMIIAICLKKINLIAMILGIIEIPIYVFILSLKNKWKYLIIIFHIIAVIFVLNMSGNIFNS